jgi:DNA-binding transcriptional LysR family regulator
VHTDFEFMRIGDLHRAMQQRHPRISPHFLHSMTSQILPDLRRGTLDAGFFFGPCRYADLAVYPLAQVPMRIVAPGAWRTQVTQASLDQLSTMPWVYTSDTCPFYQLMQSLFDDAQQAPARVAYCDSEDAVRTLVRAGAGLSILRADDAERLQSDGDTLYWDGATPSIALSFAVQRQRAAEPLIDAVRELVCELWRTAEADVDSAEA